MSMKRIYSCNLCRENIADVKTIFGLHFTGMKNFTLGGYGCTEGSHICYMCAKQLQVQLNSQEITKELDILK